MPLKKKFRLISAHARHEPQRPEVFAHSAGPDFEITEIKLESGAVSIESAFDEVLSSPGIVARAIEAEHEGMHGVIIDCMGDPGLYAAREAVNIPVLGPGEISMHVAAMLGHQFSVVTVMDRLRPILENHARVYGVFDKLASVRAVEMPVLDIDDHLDELTRRLIEESVQSVRHDKADVIVLGCTGFMGCADAIAAGLAAQGLHVPVIDPIPTAILIGGALVDAKLSHSPRCYPAVPRKPMIGFRAVPASKT
jgi:allantoin racemase